MGKYLNHEPQTVSYKHIQWKQYKKNTINLFLSLVARDLGPPSYIAILEEGALSDEDQTLSINWLEFSK